jgi:hypothetical protein
VISFAPRVLLDEKKIVLDAPKIFAWSLGGAKEKIIKSIRLGRRGCESLVAALSSFALKLANVLNRDRTGFVETVAITSPELIKRRYF